MQGNAQPVIMDESVVRTKEIVQLFQDKVVSDTTAKDSEGVNCEAFRKFLLYIALDSTSTPTTLHIEVQFLDRWDGKWYTYKQGPFASLYYEDGDTASGIYECFSGDCCGRAMRIKLTGAGTDSTHYFTTSIAVEFRN